MLVKYVTFERYAIEEKFNLYNILESLSKEYPSNEFTIEAIFDSEYGDEKIIKISQTVPFGVEPAHMGFKFDNGEYY